jgi:hypothetical protein
MQADGPDAGRTLPYSLGRQSVARSPRRLSPSNSAGEAPIGIPPVVLKYIRTKPDRGEHFRGAPMGLCWVTLPAQEPARSDVEPYNARAP